MIKKDFTKCCDINIERDIDKRKYEYFNDLGYNHFMPKEHEDMHLKKYMFTSSNIVKKKSKR